MSNINVFGRIIKIPQTSFNDEILVDQIIKSHKERAVFNEFLNSGIDGEPIKNRLMVRAERESGIDTHEVSRVEAIEAIIKRLKEIPLNGHNLYENFVLSIIEAENRNSDTVSKIRKGVVSSTEVPDTFPGMRKQAEILLRGKINTDLNQNDIDSYKKEKHFMSLLRLYSKDLFYAFNNCLEERALDFLRIMYRLDELQTADILNRSGLQKIIAGALQGETIDLVHIKSLRFTYPGGKSLKMLEDLKSVKQDGLPGEKREYPTEEVIFVRIRKLQEFLNNFGIKTKLTVIVSDHDLDYCFPLGQSLVPKQDVVQAKKSVDLYIKRVKKFLNGKAETFSLTEFLAQNKIADNFNAIFNALVQEAQNGRGVNINEKMLVSVADAQFEHYKQMFGSYSHDQARYTSVRQMANVLALSEVFSVFPRTPLLVIDNRGVENKLIGGYKQSLKSQGDYKPEPVVKYFTKLKDPVKITQGY